MAKAPTWEAMAPGLLQVVERAPRDPAGLVHSRAHRIGVPAVERASPRQRADAAVGVDGGTKEASGRHREAPLQALHRRLQAKRSRPQPLRRGHIPKAQGKTRPMGIAAVEDTLVQDAVREVREAMYAQAFLDCSHGFRPARQAHDAVRILKRIVERGEGRWLYAADLVSCVDSVDRTALKKMLEVRIADGSLMRLMGKDLHVGVLDGATIGEPERGTAQGSVLSAWVGKVDLHDVLALGCATEVKPRLRGKATLTRYCDGMPVQA